MAARAPSRVDVLRRAADHERELRLPVRLGLLGRHDDRVTRPDDGARQLGEDERRRRDRGAALGGVVGVVQSDADELRRLDGMPQGDLADPVPRPVGGLDRLPGLGGRDETRRPGGAGVDDDIVGAEAADARLAGW